MRRRLLALAVVLCTTVGLLAGVLGTATAPAFATSLSWTQLTPSTSPSARFSASMAYDPATGQLILFGGDENGFLNDTWAWDGSAWTNVTPTTSTSPPVRDGASMAYDPAKGQLILFGGVGNSGNLGDTWAWDGSAWSNVTPTSTGPSARQQASMAYDPASGQLILFGGNGNSGFLNDTWAWDGSAWSEVTLSTSPSIRYGASMAYDPAKGQLILFGGVGTSGLLNDTWAWTGTNWTQLTPATSPPARYGASMADDPATGQPILFGGVDNSGNLGDTWEWTGSTWSEITASTSPQARVFASMAYDPAKGQLILFGGFRSGPLGDTWDFGNSLPTANAGGPYSGPEGASIAISGTAADPDGDTVVTSWAVTANPGDDPGASCFIESPASLSTSVICGDDGSYTLTLFANDLVNTPRVISTTTVTVTNAAVTVNPITAPISPVASNTPVTTSASFSDPGTFDSHTATWNWGDGSTSPGTVTELIGGGTVSGSHTYATPGVYTVSLTVSDGDSPPETGTATSSYVVIYDPTAGFVTGGGWINSPLGAYPGDPALTGKLDFGFVSHYETGATVPTGRTEFHLQAAGLDFVSTDYQWLVISGGIAQYSGDGTVNGAPGYSFRLTACDANLQGTCAGGTTDSLRIEVWTIDPATQDQTVVYDNAPGPNDLSSNTQALGGGDIVIHD